MRIIKGFTLIEMVIVMVITGIVIAITATMLNTSFISYFTSVHFSSLSTQGAIAMMRISKELQQASQFSVINATSVTFTTTGGSTISYSWSTPTLTRTGSAARTLSNVVTSFSLSYYQANFNTTATASAVRAVTVSMTVSNGTESVPLINTIYLSNM
jgi:prepilin-type N-terminal cleavage/methylation domain-containing protein